jgi:hypothetical protein
LENQLEEAQEEVERLKTQIRTSPPPVEKQEEEEKKREQVEKDRDERLANLELEKARLEESLAEALTKIDEAEVNSFFLFFVIFLPSFCSPVLLLSLNLSDVLTSSSSSSSF